MANICDTFSAEHYARELISFYKYVADADFSSLSDEDFKTIQSYVKKWTYFFKNKTCGLTSLMAFTAEKMRISNGYYGPKTKDEKALFYILMVDPDLLFLEVYESANTINERRDLAHINFRIVDIHLMHLEKTLNEQFKIYDPNDIWALDRIKR